MREVIFGFLFTFVFLYSTALAQTDPVQITGGRFLISGGQAESQNARIETANFTAISSLGGFYSPWYNICLLPDCRMGTSFSIPGSQIYVGGCVGSCYQFISGTFTINGVTYQNVYFRGNFNLPQVTFQIPKIARRKGLIRLSKPFTMDGRLQVCQVSDINQNCPADKILFVGDVKGEGTVAVTAEIKIFDNGTARIPYLLRKSFDYQFEP